MGCAGTKSELKQNLDEYMDAVRARRGEESQGKGKGKSWKGYVGSEGEATKRQHSAVSFTPEGW